MKAFLMHRDRDFDREPALPSNEQALRQDLELDTLFHAMAGGDDFLFEMTKAAVLSSLTDPEAIVYRQRVLGDCLEHPAVAREIYDIAAESAGAERKVSFGFMRSSPDGILYRSVQVLEILVDLLKRLRRVAGDHGGDFRSDGFQRFFAMLVEELDDEYFATIDDHLRRLRFRDGVLISARLGTGNKGVDYTLRRPSGQRRSWVPRVTLPWDHSAYTYRLSPRDEAGARALSELRQRGVNLVANALGQSTDHIVSFLSMLRSELAFYVGCLNLHERLAEKGEPVCFPVPAASGESLRSARGLYDVCLSLSVDGPVVGNDLAADGTSLVMITGANQGGKSTFLRGMGLAQLMMQSGMFVAAEALRASVRSGLFTHYKREEDAAMKSGKLDEELSRMSDIADHIGPGCVLLCNESFASTNEREGSEIARQIVRGLLESGVDVLFVTHLFELAHGLHREQAGDALFLRAERMPDGRRTFRLVEGEPLPTSYGRDLYERIFATSDAGGHRRAIGSAGASGMLPPAR